MQSFFNELSTPVSDSAKCKVTKTSTKCVIVPELIVRYKVLYKVKRVFLPA